MRFHHPLLIAWLAILLYKLTDLHYCVNYMLINKIVTIILGLLSIVVIPLQLVTTFVLGIAVSLSFGLLLVPLSLVWILLLGPMLLCSYLYENVPILGRIFGLIGIPFSVLGHVYTALIPSMGEFKSRYVKLLLCDVYPYTWSFNLLNSGKEVTGLGIDRELSKILEREFRHNPNYGQAFPHISDQIQSDCVYYDSPSM